MNTTKRTWKYVMLLMVLASMAMLALGGTCKQACYRQYCNNFKLCGTGAHLDQACSAAAYFEYQTCLAGCPAK